MPPRRKVLTSAAALPASRLPLGFHHPASTRSPGSRTTSRASQHSQRAPSHSSDSEKGSAHPEARTVSMTASSDSLTTLSIAEAKLARQTKRIQQAEAALTAPMPPPTERERQPPRIKGKKAWQPFDYTADSSPAGPPAGDGGGVEIRVNTFRAPPTRDSSLNRSMSSLSQRTTSTMPSERDRLDLATADPGGFQLYAGRKGKKNFEQLNAYEDKPEQKQATVEATIDAREIYEVFGNALPSLDFLQQNPGMKEGQLQFLQHPNGDVAAHQWSADRFMWANIGHFSNIRKKVEGQLAADRLKGETADQTLLQNTLRYFRAIAKQREAAAMGIPFGIKDIQAILPDLRPAQPAAAAPPKKLASELEDAASDADPNNTQTKAEAPVLTRNESHGQQYTEQAYPYEHYSGYGASSGYTNPSNNPYAYSYGYATGHPYGQPHYRVPTAPRAEREGHYNNHFFQGNATGAQDPFYTDSTFRNPYAGLPSAFGGQQQHQQPHQQSRQTAYGGLPDYADKVQSLNYDWSFPVTATGSKAAKPSREYRPQQAEPARMFGMTGNAYAQYVTGGVKSVRTSLDQSTSDRGEFLDVRTTDTLRPNAVTPRSSRAAMRESLAKLSDQAKERSLSQTNIRTVLYDPMCKHTETPEQSAGSGLDAETVKQEPAVELKRTVANPSGLPPGLHRTASKQNTEQAHTWAPTVPRVGPTFGAEVFSSPSIHKRTLKVAVTPCVNKETSSKLGDLLIGSTPVDADFDSTPTTAENPATKPKSREAELKDWWLNPITFARHEDLFESIKLANKNSSPAAQAPIGTPAKDSTTATAKEGTNTSDAFNRALIPVWENLASYTQGPMDKRRDYFTPWTKPPEWAIDLNSTDSYYDKPGEWGQPPARIGRDARYRDMPSQGLEATPQRGMPGLEQSSWPRFGAFSSPTAGAGSGLAVGAGLEKRFAFGRL